MEIYPRRNHFEIIGFNRIEDAGSQRRMLVDVSRRWSEKSLHSTIGTRDKGISKIEAAQ